ncbi:Asp-tRNA(Asn)/Glu-tRNA(Gln) amidotransferase subunit GatB [Candidatus Saccharibacteria bacterium CG_4_10_14_0_2_um_filter_52_9]|nr:MAG: Asp-tRNA(Asn)/Glu-tRNA(Gln) amidotransferase subunit GatB [Candidatus Saccharibacteria bacterium CG_4_10_14_0_2_um_filter_52_9]
MIDSATRAKYTTTIGIECHVQLKTKTKLFAAVGNDAREAPPNTLVSHICFGLPGALPVLNKEALTLATRAAFALGTEPERFSKFDRKHYFYPDLPKGYQISQYDQPIIGKGEIMIEVNGQPKKVGITRAHLEEDAGKSTHPEGSDYSLIDLNRAGTPLLEIVSEPDMHSSAEAKAYAHELYLRMRYADVSDANLYYGNMRFDVNVSVSKTKELGIRSETKNLNSFRSVEKAVDYEVTRQIERLEKGERIIQETRGWDDAKQKSFSQRSKENADDYRYMPDPDIPPIIIEPAFVAKIKAVMPELPDDYRAKFKALDMDAVVIEDIIAVPETAKLVSRILGKSNAGHARRVAFWMMQPTSDEDTQTEARLAVSDEELIKLSEMVSTNKLSSTAGKDVLAELLKKGGDPEKIAADKNLLQVSDEGEIAKIVQKVLVDNAAAAEDVKKGEMKAIGFLVGQVMKESKGKANPSLAQELIKKQLGQ